MTEPGLYWGKFESYSPDTDKMPWEIFVVQHNNVAKLLRCPDWRYPLGSDAKVKIRFGPRIPTAAEIEEWGNWEAIPTCPECGDRDTFEYIIEREVNWLCETCGKWFKVEARYRVKP